MCFVKVPFLILAIDYVAVEYDVALWRLYPLTFALSAFQSDRGLEGTYHLSASASPCGPSRCFLEQPVTCDEHPGAYFLSLLRCLPA